MDLLIDYHFELGLMGVFYVGTSIIVLRAFALLKASAIWTSLRLETVFSALDLDIPCATIFDTRFSTLRLDIIKFSIT